MCVWCEGDGCAGVGSGLRCMSGTHGSGVLSSTGDVLVECVTCVCVLARGGVGGEGG